MRKQADPAAKDDDEDDDDDDEEDSALEEVQRTAENMKIFCCSSTEYLKLKGKLSKDGPPQVR
jgi:hypothetical protein